MRSTRTGGNSDPEPSLKENSFPLATRTSQRALDLELGARHGGSLGELVGFSVVLPSRAVPVAPANSSEGIKLSAAQEPIQQPRRDNACGNYHNERCEDVECASRSQSVREKAVFRSRWYIVRGSDIPGVTAAR